MEKFYTELKKLREQQEIDLAEISNRTKINIKFLESIESGDFSFLPYVYIRLFLRAYVTEIGADTDDALNQLELHLSKTEELPRQPKELIEDFENEADTEVVDLPEKSPFELRSDLIKVAILLAIFLFAIYIIKKITSSKPAELNNSEFGAIQEYTPPLGTNPVLSQYFVSIS